MDGYEDFFSRFRELVEESRDALGPTAEVKDPFEYRFEILLGNRGFALQGVPGEGKVLVGEETGTRGVVWFDELKYDEVTSGWGTPRQSAWDFIAGLSDLPPLPEQQAAKQAEAVESRVTETIPSADRRGRPSPRGLTRVLTGVASAGIAWLGVRTVRRQGQPGIFLSRLRRKRAGGDSASR